MCVRCGAWNHTEMRALWKVISHGWLDLKDIGQCAQTNARYRMLANVFIQRIKKK